MKACKYFFVSSPCRWCVFAKNGIRDTPLFFPWLSKCFLDSARGVLHPQTPRPGCLSVGTHCGQELSENRGRGYSNMGARMGADFLPYICESLFSGIVLVLLACCSYAYFFELLFLDFESRPCYCRPQCKRRKRQVLLDYFTRLRLIEANFSSTFLLDLLLLGFNMDDR